MTAILILLALILVVVVLLQVARTLDLVEQIKNPDDGEYDTSANFNAYLFLLFLVVGLIGSVYCFPAYDNLLPVNASEHGKAINRLFVITLVITGIVFVITQILLFVFSFIYQYNKDRTPSHFAHSNKLEMIWTAIPAVAMTILVIFGLQAWHAIMDPQDDHDILVEVTGKQFDWTFRYPGEDGKLGLRDYNLISQTGNKLGLVSEKWIEHRLVELGNDTIKLQAREIELKALISEMEKTIDSDPNKYKVEKLEDELALLEEELDGIPAAIKNRTLNIERINERYTDEYLKSIADMLKDGEDDIITTEIRLPVNRKVKVKIVAMDVLHNFYLPNFDVKMDAVPGMPTQFVFTPITTTVEMREILKDNPVWSQLDDDPDEPQPRYKSFNYEVACAELCGRGHSSMQATLVIGTDEEYEAWLATQPLYYETVKETLLKEANAASAFNQN